MTRRVAAFFRRLRALWRHSREADALREELETHRQFRQARLEREGLGTDEAEALSRRLMGNAVLAREDVRDLQAGWIDPGWLVVRHGVHGLGAHWRFGAVTASTLALCLGASLLVFTIVNALWLRPPPVPEPDRVVMITNPGGLGTSGGYFAAQAGLERLRHQPVFERVAGQVATSGHNSGYRPHIVLEGAGGPVEAVAVTPEYFAAAGLSPLGRDFSARDDQPGAAPVAIISHRLWSRRFERDPALIGRTIDATPVPVQVIGIAPPSFQGVRLGERTDLWIPRALTSRVALGGMARENPPLLIIARLSPGLSAASAREVMYRDWRDVPATAPPPAGFIRAPSTPPMAFAGGRRAPLEFVPIGQTYGSPTSRTLVVREHGVLLVAGVTAALVLLGGCATLMSLILASYEQRRQELAVRLALGCSRVRLIASLLVELAAIAGAGLSGALLLAWSGAHALPALSLPGGLDLSRLDLAPDWRVVLGGALAAAATIGLATAVPLVRSTRPALASDLTLSSGRSTSSSFRTRRGLLATQVAATVVVLVAANLFVLTVRDGFRSAPGFDVDRTLFIELHALPMTGRAAETQAAVDALATKLRTLVDRLGTIPGVEVVAAGAAPLGLDQAVFASNALDVAAGDRRRTLRLARVLAEPAYLRALGATLLAGRALTAADIRSGTEERPAVITASLAEALWPGGGALGQSFSAGVSYQVVGIVADIVQGSLRLDQRLAVFSAWSLDQEARRDGASLTVRVAADPLAFVEPVRAAIASEFGPLPHVDVAPGREIVARDLGGERLGAWFFSGFGLVALALGIGGVAGLVAHLIAARRREIGIRLALGATTQSVIWLTFAAALTPALAGGLAGLVSAAVLARSLGAWLPHIRSLDAGTALAMPGLMLACAAAAGLIAAWNVRRVSAAEALRAE